ncbi:NAD kinase [Exiguobacterium sp.]|nr:NAD kinase [Exiguobacterium sp.]
MRFAITARDDERSHALKQQLEQALTDRGCVLDVSQPEIVVSIGGDGTMLQAFHSYLDQVETITLVGIHTGHLGFYADWRPEEMDELIDHIAKQDLATVEYPLLELSIDYADGSHNQLLALNECTIKSFNQTLVCDLSIRGDYFETFRGDGLCVSTPSGSTAYNKALGGAIVHPALEAIQITEMASINNRVYRTIGSPMLLPKHHDVEIRPVNPIDFQMTYDHYASIVHQNVTSIRCRVSDKKVKFARFRSFPFWQRVRESFLADERR